MNTSLSTPTARPSSTLRLLLVDRDGTCRQTLRRALEARIARPLAIRDAASLDEALELAGQTGFDAMVVDLETAGGPEIFGTLVAAAGEAIVYAAGVLENVGDAVAAVRNGAADFLEKPLDGLGFARRIERHFVAATGPANADFEGFIGISPAIRSVFEQTLRYGNSDAPVLITGEAGVGKSLLARAIHRRSRRRIGPFNRLSCVGIDCADLAAALAPGREDGTLAHSSGGSLFLDDIDELDIQGQAVLFRFLEGCEAGRQDGLAPDVRLISTAGSSAEDLVSHGRLRWDLLFRLNVLAVHIPPLRERPDDIVLLAEHFLARLARTRASTLRTFDAEARRLLVAHDWPGNARELEVLVQRLATIGADGTVVTGEMIETISPAFGQAETIEADGEAGAEKLMPPGRGRVSRIRPLWMEERRIIEGAITAYGGNIARAAAALEISPSTIYRKRQSWSDLAGQLAPEPRVGLG